MVPHAFRRRWHFATSRLAVQENPFNRDLLLEMGGRNKTDRAVLNYLLNTFGRKSARVLNFGLALVAVSALRADRAGNNRTGAILGLDLSKALQRMTKRCLSDAR